MNNPETDLRWDTRVCTPEFIWYCSSAWCQWWNNKYGGIKSQVIPPRFWCFSCHTFWRCTFWRCRDRFKSCWSSNPVFAVSWGPIVCYGNVRTIHLGMKAPSNERKEPHRCDLCSDLPKLHCNFDNVVSSINLRLGYGYWMYNTDFWALHIRALKQSTHMMCIPIGNISPLKARWLESKTEREHE